MQPLSLTTVFAPLLNGRVASWAPPARNRGVLETGRGSLASTEKEGPGKGRMVYCGLLLRAPSTLFNLLPPPPLILCQRYALWAHLTKIRGRIGQCFLRGGRGGGANGDFIPAGA